MRKILLVLGLAYLGSHPGAASSFPRAPGGFGVTPAGAIWRSDGSNLFILSTDGQERARFVLQPDEKNVLSMADDGSRVTSPWPGGTKLSFRSREKTRRVRMVFRDANGTVLRMLEPEGVVSNSAFFGNEAHFVRADKTGFVLVRASAMEGEAPLTNVAKKKIMAETGRVDEVRVHASAAGVVVDLRGPYRSAYLDTAGTLILPDPAIDCGTWGWSESVFPGSSGSLGRVRPSGGPDGPEIRLERIGRDGRLLASVAIRARGPSVPLAGGGLLIIEEAETVIVDERGTELQRSAFPRALGTSREAAARLASARRQFEEKKPGRAGAEWVELALAAPAFQYEGVDEAARDLDGTLQRFLEIPDGNVDEKAARSVLRGFIFQVPFLDRTFGLHGSRADGDGERIDSKKVLATLLDRLDSVGPSAPGWFCQAAAPFVIRARKDKAGPWAFEALAQILERGDRITPELPPGVVTQDLAERIALFDRARLDQFDARRATQPEGGPPQWNEAVMFSSLNSGNPGFHIPGGRFPEILFSCLPGSGPARFEAVISALREPAADYAFSQEGFQPEEAEEMELHVPQPPSEEEALLAAGRIGQLIVSCAKSSDPDLKAGALLLSPYYRASLNAESFRSVVLSRPELLELAASSLLLDRSLRSDVWTKLFSELLGNARRLSRNPAGCVERLRIQDDDEAFVPDPYCELIGNVLSAGMALTEGEKPAGRAIELNELTRSAGAPPELRLFGKLSRVYGGQASPNELMELWNDPSLAGDTRIGLIEAARYDAGSKAAMVAVASQLLLQVRQRRLPEAEERSLVDVLGEVSPEETGRLAAELLVSGKLSFPDSDAADTWLSHFDAATVSTDPKLRGALKDLLADENAGPRAALVLAKVGEPTALAPLLTALKNGCFG